jgi:hypothetical protein
MCEADPTTGREVESGAIERADGEWKKEKGTTSQLVTDLVIETLVPPEE